MIEETEVIRRVLGGEVESFGLLVQRYQRPITSVVGNMVSDRHCCEDLVQDVFLTAFDRLGAYDARRGKFSTWLFAIARNRCLNALKKRAPMPMGELSQAVRPRTPHDELTEKELFERLDAALETLPREQRIVFVLAELAGVSYEEIAEIEGVKISTIRSRISRTKEKLRSLLRDYVGDRT